MGFKLLLLRTEGKLESYLAEEWPARVKEVVPAAEVHLARSEAEAEAHIADADAAFGWIGPKLFGKARRLRWLACPQAGPDPGFFHAPLVKSDVAVTNMRGIFNEHISEHILAYLLMFARGLHVYLAQQREHLWQPGARVVYLPEATAVVVGVGGIGGETARLLKELHMTVLGVDARLEERPPYLDALHRPKALDEVLPRGDFVIATVPETPATRGLFNAGRFARMKNNAFFINIGRGATTVLADLDAALRAGTLAGAGLDVYEVEPLPADHPLWDAPNAILTPHVAVAGPHIDERRTQVFLENCRRFDRGEPLINVVDKRNWF